MTAQVIRPVAICVFRHEGRILAVRGHDPHRQGAYLRPVGGGIEFGESGAQTLVREVGDEPRHEIVLVYDARFTDASLYGREVLRGKESDGTDYSAIWVRPEDTKPETPLYPEGLAALLAADQAMMASAKPAKAPRRKKSLVDLLHAHRADIEAIIAEFDRAQPPGTKRR